MREEIKEIVLEILKEEIQIKEINENLLRIIEILENTWKKRMKTRYKKLKESLKQRKNALKEKLQAKRKAFKEYKEKNIERNERNEY
jgi:hypothetical protein